MSEIVSGEGTLQVEKASNPDRNEYLEAIINKVSELCKKEITASGGYPSEFFFLGSKEIKDGNIEVVKMKDRYRIYFDLVPDHFKVPSSVGVQESVTLERGEFRYISEAGERLPISDSITFHPTSKSTVRIATGVLSTVRNEIGTEPPRSMIIRKETMAAVTSQCMIEIIDTMDPHEIITEFQAAASVLAIRDSSFKITPEKMNERLKATFIEHYGRDPEPSELENITLADGTSRHTTFINRAERLAQEPSTLLLHRLSLPGHLLSILRNGLISSESRHRKGKFVEGLSRNEDFKSGGAKSVFLRLLPSDVFADYSLEGYVHLVFDKKILERMDWYAFEKDQYGGISKSNYEKRLRPDKLLKTVKENKAKFNEIVFPVGISFEQIRSIVVSSEEKKTELILLLRKNGATEEEVEKATQLIIVAETIRDLPTV